ncbi:MAG: tetratricopeptide repeat protein [Pseudomonadota bacterium]
MDTVSKPDTARLLDPANAQLSGQARVNAEIFTAVEILGRKLERSEAERDRLARRLALIESAASVDEKTGRLYLPVVKDSAPAKKNAESFSPKGMAAVALACSVVTLFVLGIMLFREPAPSLTKDQLAALDSLKGVQFALLSPEGKGWKPLEGEGQQEVASAASAASAASVASVASVVSDPPATVAAAQSSSDMPELPKQVEVPVVEAVPLAPPAAVAAVADTPLKGKGAEAVEAKDIKADIPPVVFVKKEEPPPQQELIAPSPPVVVADTAAGVGMKPDPALPEKLAALEKRAYQGVPEAEHDLATLYASGRLVAQNYNRAVYWFSRAADGGVANAHYNLGVIYHQGLGVRADVQKALGWYEKAAELGHPEAMYNLGIAYVEGIGTKTNIEKGVSYFKRAASAGVAQAAYNLGVLYESNFIGTIDLDKAAEWYQVAADGGHADARVAFNRLKGAGDQPLTLADMVEPASGEEYGEGDSSPVEKAEPAPRTCGEGGGSRPRPRCKERPSAQGSA